MDNNKSQVIEHAMTKVRKHDSCSDNEIIETLNEIYTLCGVEYIATGVLLIASSIRMWN